MSEKKTDGKTIVGRTRPPTESDDAQQPSADYLHKAQKLEREISAFFSIIREQTGEIFDGAENYSLRETADRLSKIIQDEKRYRLLVDQANDIIYQTDAQGRFTFFNAFAEKIIGFSTESITGSHYLDLVHPDYKNTVRRFYSIQFVKGIVDTYFEIPIITKTNETIWLGQHVQLLWHNDAVIGFQAIARDITDRKMAEEALRVSEEKHRTIIENIEEGYYEVDLYGRITFCNDSLVRILGRSREQIPSLDYRDYMDTTTARRVFRTFYTVYKTRTTARALDWTLIRMDGTKSIVEVSVTLMTDQLDRPIGYRGIARDITERKKMEQELRRLSITDNLTGLFNRRHFDQKIADEAKRARRMSYPLCLIIFDLDNFKAYNDTYGHPSGDEVLKEIGTIMKGCIREDMDTAFRYGGDEFAMILPSATVEDAWGVVDRIRQGVLQKVHGIDISVGITPMTEDGTPEALIRAADTAMYGQKGMRRKK